MIGRFIILPHLKVGVYALKPYGLWDFLWKVIIKILFKIFSYIIMALHCLWIIWLIIKKYVPNFPIPLKNMLLKIAPFPQLERSGIFYLFGACWGAILSTSPIKDRLTRVGYALADFFTRNMDLAFSTIGLHDTVEKIQYATRDKSGAPQPDPYRNPEPPIPPSFTDYENREIDDMYQQCIEENTVIPTEGASKLELKQLEAKNKITQTLCNTKRLQSMMHLSNFSI